jgi:cytoskeleton protein RodZ
MTELDARTGAAGVAAPESAGALLRAAREAAGLSVDAVAQQLKLAPRQVKAIEDGEFAQLPGRTFVRGFVRNYARLLRLDPDPVLGALSADGGAPALEAPSLHPTAPSIGEIPTAETARSSWTRWFIPATLIAIIGATIAYEQMRAPAESRRAIVHETAPGAEPRAIEPAPEVGGTALPNPTTAAATAEPAQSGGASESSAPAAKITAASASETQQPADTVATAPLTLAFRDFSWTEVKDRSGATVLKQMNRGDTTQTVEAAPPLDLVIGNANDVTLTWRGQRVDLAPYTRGNVARLRLQ